MARDILSSLVVSFALFGLFLLYWTCELPCQGKLPEFHYIPIVGCIRVFWLVLHPLGLELDKAVLGWNSVTTAIPDVTYLEHMSHIHEHCILINMEQDTTAADKKHVQAIQKAEFERVETNNANLSQQGHGGSCGTGGRGGNRQGHNNQG